MLPNIQHLGRIFLVASCILFCTSKPSHAQFYEKGQDPAFIVWKQIRTDHFQIIFPESYTKEAQRLTNILEYAYNYVAFSLRNKPRKISVIIHNYSVRFNGFVAWAPKRMELYPTPSQDMYPQDVLEQLAIHELRHVVQVDKLHQGITKILYYIFGEMAPGVIAGMLPIWFLEGDAVATETALSNTGRGRLPSFRMKLRTLLLEKGDVYPYDKAYNGSYKDYVPNYYQYGYQMIAYSRQKYGSRWWDKSLNYVAKNPYLINPIHFSLYNNIGLNKRRLYDATFHELEKLWLDNAKGIRYTEFDTINTRNKNVYTSYRFPQYLNDSMIIAKKSSLDKVGRFVALNRRGEETVLHIPGFHEPVCLSVGSNSIIWAEIIPDVRWNNREYSVIKKFDLTTKQDSTLTRNTRYFSPAISPDGTKISTIEVTVQNEERLVILDAENGRVLQEIDVPAKTHAMMPAWSKNGEYIILIVLNEKGKSIQIVDLKSELWEVILKPGFDDIMHVTPYRNFVLFHATYSGIDNIYAIDRQSHEIFQVVSSKNGAFDMTVSPDGSKLAYSDYSASGYNLAEMILNESNFQPIERIPRKTVTWYEDLASQEADVIESEDIPSREYNVKPYYKLANFFHFHSWAPFYTDLDKIDLDNLQINPGLLLLSQNKLSTAFSSLGYTYKNNHHFFYSKLTYKGMFPVLDISWNYGGDPLIYPDSLSVSSSDRSLVSRVYIPFNLTRDRFRRGLVPSFEAEYRNRYIFNEQTDRLEKGLWSNRYRLYFYNYLTLAHRDIRPKWGQVFDFRYSLDRFNGENMGSVYSLRTVFYFPGFITNHSIQISAGFEKRNDYKRIFFYNSLDFPRGYESFDRHNSNILRLAEVMQSASAEYTLPLWYPDINISSIAYFKRLKGKLFCDYTRGKLFNTVHSNFNPDYSVFTSLGGSLAVDFHLLRIRFPINVGLQYAYLPQFRTYDLSMIFSIDVFGFNIDR